MTQPMQLDHIVINVHRGLDGAEKAFADLGFYMTPRGYHTLGSMNALAMFGTDYLELLGFPDGAEISRPELAAAPLGLNGLVFKTTDVDETFAHLQAVGAAGDPPKSFSRPVTLDNGETHDAKFKTVAVNPDVFSAGRLYFCEHLTPELVWRPEYQSHANKARRVEDLTVVAEDAAGMAELMANIIYSQAKAGDNALTVAAADNFTLRVLTPAQYQARFGGAARNMGGRSSMFGAVTVRGQVSDTLAGGGDDRFAVMSIGSGHSVVVNDYDVIMSFTP